MTPTQIARLASAISTLVAIADDVGADHTDVVMFVASACSQQLTGAEASTPIATQLLAGAATRMAELRIAAPAPTIRTCPCKFIAGDAAAPTSPAWHRAHRIHHLATFPNVDHATRGNLDLLVEMAERGELTSRMFS